MGAMRGVAARTERFTESVIREMTRLIQFHHGADGINLAQGFPDFPAPQVLKDAACQAIQADVNQYAVTWGAPGLRRAIAAKYARFYGVNVDPDGDVTVCCGATEAMVSTLLATVNPGDEVVVIAPFYENYWPDSVLAGATPRFIHLREPAMTDREWGEPWRLDLDELRAAFSERTAAIVINSPNNPTGKLLSGDELRVVAELCQRWDALAITDEIYEHIVYQGKHVPLATLPGMRERTVTISGISKTYSVTGWRVGWAIATPRITNAIRKVHDFLTVGAAAPLQAAAEVALGLPDSYYAQLAADYARKRETMLRGLAAAGFRFAPPEGAYYVMADIAPFGFDDDVALARHLVVEHGLALVPGSSFYPPGQQPRQRVRFSFPKKLETLDAAAERLASFAASRRSAAASR
ncbi:MAG TPA: aminotransferase class I/II-fold pyridoxal phosphate-dependent enzyme [Chloroflexota bacterium]|nr:aminotransferase class I/II-fold pyridoxal phosphate-dependent enzyme [Chloroflexota bacterium]